MCNTLCGLGVYLMMLCTIVGSSISVGERKGVSLYFTGAPRFEHKGQVVLFRNKGKEWEVAQRVKESQVCDHSENICAVI